MRIIDLRSDTVTRPTAAMREVMSAVPLGDDVYAEDPTVNRLQEKVAELTGKEAGLFLPSGTMSNLVALLAHCGRGDEYIVGQQAHAYKYEGGGAAAFGGIVPQPLDFQPDGTLDLDQVRLAIKPRDHHFAVSRLLCIENSQAGRVLPHAYHAQVALFAAEHGLSLHLDGARLFNAAIAANVSLEEITRHYDTVSICLSKGLGATVGSVLVGSADMIESAHRWRKVCGGGMRQAGMLAGAGIYALDEQVERLAIDHANARKLAEGLMQIEAFTIDLHAVQSNMVFIDCAQTLQDELIPYLRERGILVGGYGRLRLVTHLDVATTDIPTVIGCFKSFFADRES
jgi:threonine aldolase